MEHGRGTPSSSGGSWHRAPLDGDRGVVEIAGRRLAVFRNGEHAWAVDAACPHEGNPLVEGELLGTMLVCAFHGWRFDLETGACLWGEEPVCRYPAEVRDGEVWVQTT